MSIDLSQSQIVETVNQMKQLLTQEGRPGTITVHTQPTDDSPFSMVSLVTYGMPLYKLPELAILFAPLLVEQEFSFRLSHHGLRIAIDTLIEFFTDEGLSSLKLEQLEVGKSFVLKNSQCMIRLIVTDYPRIEARLKKKAEHISVSEDSFYDMCFFLNTQLYAGEPFPSRYLAVTHLHFGDFEHRCVIDYHEKLAVDHRWQH